MPISHFMGNQLLMQRITGVDWSQWFDHFWQAKGAVSYAASLLDLVGAQNLVEGNGAVPWAEGTGWGLVVGNAQWLDTGLIPANDQSWSALVQFANAANNGEIFGADNAFTRHFGILPRPGAFVRYINGRNIDVAPLLLTGNLGVSGNQAYRNGVNEGGPIIGWGGASLLTIFIGARNAGVAATFITADIYAIGIKKGPALTAPQVAAAAAEMALI